MLYVPPPRKPRLFPRLARWFFTAIGCVGFVLLLVLLMWELDAWLHPY